MLATRFPMYRWLGVAILGALALVASASFSQRSERTLAIARFEARQQPHGVWVLSGLVTARDHNPVGWIVYFGGALEGYQATVENDGTFALVVQLDSTMLGDASAQVADNAGVTSNRARVTLR